MSELRQAAQAALDALESDAIQRTFAGGVRMSNAAIALRAALAQPPAPTAQQCPCKDRPADQCPGEWEPGCDLGANPAHALGGRPVQQPTPCFCDQNNIGAPGVSCGDCPTRDYAQPADTIDCKSVQKRLAVQQPGAEPFAHICVLPTKDAGPTKFFTAPSDPRGFPVYLAAPAQRQPLSDEQIDSLTFPFLTAELGPTAYDRAIARAIEAAHGIAAQKGEKL